MHYRGLLYVPSYGIAACVAYGKYKLSEVSNSNKDMKRGRMFENLSLHLLKR